MEQQMIEQKAAETILEKKVSVNIGEKTYEVASPSVATLIMVSEAVARLPHVALDPEKVVEECLSVGKDCRALGEIAAILILGAKGCMPQPAEKPFLWGLFSLKGSVSPVEVLQDEILMHLSPSDLFSLITKILGTMELSDFFGLTTFLTEINLLRQKKVEN